MIVPTRRSFLRAGVLAPLGLGLADRFAAAQAGGDRRGTSCILVWLHGGPSHLDMFDPKPDAAAEVRGPFRPIATRVPGVFVGEDLPGLAQRLDRACVVRSVTSPLGEHNLGSAYVLTGTRPTPALEYPSYGAVVAAERPGTAELPPYVAVPSAVAAAGAGFLTASARPFAVGGDPARPDFRVRDLDPPAGLGPGRIDRRRAFLEGFDRGGPADPHFERAYRLVASPAARAAFDLAREPDAGRDRYGRHTLGQSCLLARRLVEAGCPFVTVTDPGWDTHATLVRSLREGFAGGRVGKLPRLDQALSALLDDLNDRRMLDSTLVVVVGEFGRTPKLNTAGGRDHWPRCFSAMLAGGGAAAGRVVGASDARGESPADQPVTPADLAHTIYHLLGIDPDTYRAATDGRPVRLAEGGRAIAECLA